MGEINGNPLFLRMLVGSEQWALEYKSEKNGVHRFWVVRPWEILMGQQRDAANTHFAFKHWITTLCCGPLFNVGDMARVAEKK